MTFQPIKSSLGIYMAKGGDEKEDNEVGKEEGDKNEVAEQEQV